MKATELLKGSSCMNDSSCMKTTTVPTGESTGVPTALGTIRIHASDVGLTRVDLPGFGGDEPPDDVDSSALTVDSPARAHLETARRQLFEYFSGRRRTFDLALAPAGTSFQCSVWFALADISYGTTVSYAELAERVGRAKAWRAVGQANGANPLPIVLPCHRVIAADGSLGGYAGGLGVKKQLLALEGALPVT